MKRHVGRVGTIPAACWDYDYRVDRVVFPPQQLLGIDAFRLGRFRTYTI